MYSYLDFALKLIADQCKPPFIFTKNSFQITNTVCKFSRQKFFEIPKKLYMKTNTGEFHCMYMSKTYIYLIYNICINVLFAYTYALLSTMHFLKLDNIKQIYTILEARGTL